MEDECKTLLPFQLLPLRQIERYSQNNLAKHEHDLLLLRDFFLIMFQMSTSQEENYKAEI